MRAQSIFYDMNDESHERTILDEWMKLTPVTILPAPLGVSIEKVN